MKILIIRHADPDYDADSLTKRGWQEAELLAERLSSMDIKEFYVSPLGRAKDTASLTLKKCSGMPKNANGCGNFHQQSTGRIKMGLPFPGTGCRRTGQ